MDVRLITVDAEFYAVEKLRRRAYADILGEGAEDATMLDTFDAASPTTWNFGCYYDKGSRRLLASMRLSTPPLPCLTHFPQVIELEGRVLEISRLCIDPDIVSPIHRFQILRALVRDAIVSCRALNIDHVAAAARPEFSIYYQRLFGFKPLGEARPYPPAAFPLPLLSLPLSDALVHRGPQYAFITNIDRNEIATRLWQLLYASLYARAA